MRFLITGHTGFKGAWLAMMLSKRGHSVSGVALDPRPDSLFKIAHVDRLLDSDVRVDIRNSEALTRALRAIGPDVVMHLAAQPLVRESYRDPRGTVATNVMGTMNLLEAVSEVDTVRAQLIVTTDKVYRNVGRSAGYREDEPLGAGDPYSTSKAMADILAQSWRSSFDGPPMAIARAGNVIGGGDDSVDRLMPDLIRAFKAGEIAGLRHPDAVRPWQHVLDCLNGYLLLVERLLDGQGEGEWNFGPDASGSATVAELAELAAVSWGDGVGWRRVDDDTWHEATQLTLDSAKARHDLGWRDHLDFASSVRLTVDWYRRVHEGSDAREVSELQLRQFDRARAARSQ